MPAWMMVASSAIGMAGGLAGIVSLVWQIVTRRKRAHHIRIDVTHGFPSHLLPDKQSGIGFNVAVRNFGVTPIEVEDYGARILPVKGSIFSPGWATMRGDEAHKLPFLLDYSHDSEWFFVPDEQLRPSGLFPARGWCFWVKLSDGKRICSKPLPLVPESRWEQQVRAAKTQQDETIESA